MDVTLSEVFEHEMSKLDIFRAHDLERFIDRTRKGSPLGFAAHVAVVGFTVDEEAVGCAHNGEAACQFVWKDDKVLFTRAFMLPQEAEEMPEWLKRLGDFGG